jgi:hypothetical protein
MTKLPKWICIEVDTGIIYCERCHGGEKLLLPMTVGEIDKWLGDFAEIHKDCIELKNPDKEAVVG